MSVQIEQVDIAKNTIVLSLELGKVTNRRTINSNTDAVKTDIDRSMLHLGIDLFDCPEQKKCQKYLNLLKAKINLHTVPSFFRGGMYLVKHEAVEIVDKMIEDAIEEFKPIVKAFADVVDQRRDESRERLKTAFNIKHYPSREQVLAAYRIEKRWLTLSTPDSLKQISVGFFEREKARAEESLKTAGNLINQLLAAEAKGLAEHLLERLTPDADGKPKIFRNSAVLNITEFLSTFQLRNVGSNDELNAQIETMRKLLSGVDPQSLRDNDQIKEQVRTGFKSVSEALDRLIIEQPERMFDFSELKSA